MQSNVHDGFDAEKFETEAELAKSKIVDYNECVTLAADEPVRCLLLLIFPL